MVQGDKQIKESKGGAHRNIGTFFANKGYMVVSIRRCPCPAIASQTLADHPQLPSSLPRSLCAAVLDPKQRHLSLGRNRHCPPPPTHQLSRLPHPPQNHARQPHPDRQLGRGMPRRDVPLPGFHPLIRRRLRTAHQRSDQSTGCPGAETLRGDAHRHAGPFPARNARQKRRIVRVPLSRAFRRRGGAGGRDAASGGGTVSDWVEETKRGSHEGGDDAGRVGSRAGDCRACESAPAAPFSFQRIANHTFFRRSRVNSPRSTKKSQARRRRRSMSRGTTTSPCRSGSDSAAKRRRGVTILSNGSRGSDWGVSRWHSCKTVTAYSLHGIA